jgi:hypothetical protein
MLIRFHVSNFLSFNEEVELSLIPGKTRRHLSHIVETQSGCGIDLLRTAIVYGPNASGKSNLVKAMEFAQKLVVQGTRIKAAISRTPFRLCRESDSRPSKFEFEFKYGKRCYIYGFMVDNQRVHEEWLYEIKKTVEDMLFERTTSSDETKVDFGRVEFSNQEDRLLLDQVALRTRPNQLFITKCMEDNIKYFEDVYLWFNKLIVIYPNSRFLPARIMAVNDNFRSSIVEYLTQFGTGICGINLEKVDPHTEIREEIIQLVKESIPPEAKNGALYDGDTDEQYLLSWTDNKLGAKKFTYKHKMTDCDRAVYFDIKDESDGTRRLLDLLPLLAGLTDKEKVIVIDELDRSLHPQLSYKLLELFLNNSSSKSQIIATTHEEHLLDQELLRRDEIWFVEKDQNGASHVYSLEEFAPRYDKNIEKGYLMGRFGAIPVFGDLTFEGQ